MLMFVGFKAICEIHASFTALLFINAFICLEEILNSQDVEGSIKLMKTNVIEIMALRGFVFIHVAL